MVTELDTPDPQRQRSARNDHSDMRDGDSAHGNPYEPAGDEAALDSDTDTADTTARDEAMEVLSDAERDTATPPVTEPGPEMPIAEYEKLTIPEVLEQVNGLSKDELSEVAAYERAHRNRKTLLAKLDRMLKAPDHAA
jgi:hypothetical protein